MAPDAFSNVKIWTAHNFPPWRWR